MKPPFEPFQSELNHLQLSLLADTVAYFADAPKLLSIPDLAGETRSVPLTGDTLAMMLADLPADAPAEKRRFSFEWTGDSEASGTVSIQLPSGKLLNQPTDLTRFSLL